MGEFGRDGFVDFGGCGEDRRWEEEEGRVRVRRRVRGV